MENFADYILSEKDWLKKIEIIHYLQKKINIYFDNVVIFKTELVKLFMEIENITEVDRNEVITACLLYACKKNDVKDEQRS